MKAAERLVRLAPPVVARPLVESGGWGMAQFSGDQRKIAERNMRRALGRHARSAQVREASRQVFSSYARYWYDSLRLPHLTVNQIDRGFTVEGIDPMLEQVRGGQGVILALPHVGGWEWAGAWLAQVAKVPVAAVAEQLEPKELFDWFVSFRTDLGMDIIPLDEDAGARTAAALIEGQVLCLLCDRDINGTGVPVDFFGEQTLLPGGPALLAIRTGAPLYPAAVFFDGRKCHGVVRPAIDTARAGKLRADVQRVTQQLANELELLITKAPEQWHLLQPNWPSDYVALGQPLPEWAEKLQSTHSPRDN